MLLKTPIPGGLALSSNYWCCGTVGDKRVSGNTLLHHFNFADIFLYGDSRLLHSTL